MTLMTVTTAHIQSVADFWIVVSFTNDHKLFLIQTHWLEAEPSLVAELKTPWQFFLSDNRDGRMFSFLGMRTLSASFMALLSGTRTLPTRGQYMQDISFCFSRSSSCFVLALQLLYYFLIWQFLYAHCLINHNDPKRPSCILASKFSWFDEFSLHSFLSHKLISLWGHDLYLRAYNTSQRCAPSTSCQALVESERSLCSFLLNITHWCYDIFYNQTPLPSWRTQLHIGSSPLSQRCLGTLISHHFKGDFYLSWVFVTPTAKLCKTPHLTTCLAWQKVEKNASESCSRDMYIIHSVENSYI